jgi:hypothetical protein
MRAPLSVVVVGCLMSLSVASTAKAQTAAAAPPAATVVDRPGFDLGLRLGYAVPMGKIANGGTGAMDNLSDGVSGMIPLQLDALYRINRQYSVGGYFGYGYAFTKDAACDTGASCSGSVMRLGIEGRANFVTAGSFMPWVGLGVGYEWLKIKESAGGASATATLSGFEYLSLQAGGSFATSADFSVGPFLSFSLGQYRSASVDGLGSGDINDKAFHEWFQLGVGGTFSL